MKKSKRDIDWLYEKKAMAKKFLAFMEYRIPIRDVPESAPEDVIVYTTKEPAIYMRKDNKLTKGLNDHKARAVRFGLFAQQMGAQQFTDFEYLDSATELMEPWEKAMFETIQGITEAPAIDNLMPTMIGGYLLSSMRYAISRAYEVAKPIHEYKIPIEQCMNAMVQFGDMGLIKGHFTDREAKTLFYKVCPIMLEIIDSGDPKERIDKTMEIFEILRPLWEEYAESMFSSFGEGGLMSMAASMLGALGKGLGSGLGCGEEIDPEEMADLADLSKGARRTTTFKKLEDMEEEERKKYEEADEEEETVLAEGEEEEEKGGSEEKGLPGSSDVDTVVYSDEASDLSTPGDFDPEEYEIEVEGYDFFDRLIQAELEIEEADTSTAREEIPDFPEIDKKYGARSYKCKNIMIRDKEPARSEHAYNKIVKKNLGNINNCYKKLKTLFAEEAEETEYRSSGKVSVERTISTTVTSKVFTKTVDPKDKSNMAVMLAIDESGSMYGSRIERAKEAAISLAEIFGKLGIPTYILGFTADTEGADAVHRHYTTWDNKKEDRAKLTSIHADSNNFDGYSIRYASNVLNLRPETHKVLIVISDGQPACRAYNRDDGYRDTKDSIREARGKGQVVLGIAIGADIDVLQKMYGRDFIFITEGKNLFVGIMKKFTEMVKKW